MNAQVREVVAATLVAIDMLRREAEGQPFRFQPARVLDFTPYAGLRVLAVNPKNFHA